ncbi:MAG: hypothetical protein RBQ88_00645 [Desulfobulbus oligotrophicus]|jgi:hypothetical protein|nr:hypothetical protein [Desulfobulbus oligotrophicus]
MLKRLVVTFLAAAALLTGILLSAAPLLLLRSQVDAPTMLMMFCLWIAAALGIGLVLLNKMLKSIWFFRGTGEPVPLDQLRQKLLAVNAMACPVSVLEKRRTLIFTWRYHDKRWCELLSRLGIRHLYELRCFFDADTRTVLLVDRSRTVDFLICPERVKTGRPCLPLPLLTVPTKQPTTIDWYDTVAEYEYHVHRREIKVPVLGTILANGWHARLCLWR